MKSILFTMTLLLSASPLLAMDPFEDSGAKTTQASGNPYSLTPEDFQKTRHLFNWGNFSALMHAKAELEKIQSIWNKNCAWSDPKVASKLLAIDRLLPEHALNIKNYIKNTHNKTSYNISRTLLDEKEMWDRLQLGELLVWCNSQEAAFILEAYGVENPKFNIAPPQDHFIRTLEKTQTIVHREEFKYFEKKGIGFTAQEMKTMSETFDWGLYEKLRFALYNGLFLGADGVINSTHEHASYILQKQAFNLKLFLNVDHIPNLDLSQKSLLKENLSKWIQEGTKEVQPLLQTIAHKIHPAPLNPFVPGGRAEPVNVNVEPIIPAVAPQPRLPLPQAPAVGAPFGVDAQFGIQLPPPPVVHQTAANNAPLGVPLVTAPVVRQPAQPTAVPARKWGTVQAPKVFR